MVNHNYWFTRPKNIIGLILIILTFIGFGKYKDIKEYLKNNKGNVEIQPQEYNQEEGNTKDSIRTKNKQEYNNNTTESKTDSTDI